MGKKFNKRVTKRTKVKLSPKEAEKIIQEEFTTEGGNRMRKDIIFSPHSPNDGTIKFNIRKNRKEAD